MQQIARRRFFTELSFTWQKGQEESGFFDSLSQKSGKNWHVVRKNESVASRLLINEVTLRKCLIVTLQCSFGSLISTVYHQPNMRDRLPRSSLLSWRKNWLGLPYYTYTTTDSAARQIGKKKNGDDAKTWGRLGIHSHSFPSLFSLFLLLFSSAISPSGLYITIVAFLIKICTCEHSEPGHVKFFEPGSIAFCCLFLS